MNMLKAKREKIDSPLEPYRFKKRHGSTTFHVAVYSNHNTKETAGDKIARLIRHDTAMGKAVNL